MQFEHLFDKSGTDTKKIGDFINRKFALLYCGNNTFSQFFWIWQHGDNDTSKSRTFENRCKTHYFMQAEACMQREQHNGLEHLFWPCQSGEQPLFFILFQNEDAPFVIHFVPLYAVERIRFDIAMING